MPPILVFPPLISGRPAWERHSWVGCRKLDQKRNLNGPTNRDHPLLDQPVKTGNESCDPMVFQTGFHVAAQSPQPMALSSPRRTRRPSPGSQTQSYRRTDLPNRSLKSIEVTVGTNPHDTSTIGTTPTLQKYLTKETVEQRPHISVAPDPITPASRTRFRSRPRKITATLNNLLDGNTQGKYHRNTL